LPDGFATTVLWPLPAKRSDSQVIRDGEDPVTQERNFEIINHCFETRDTGIGDAGFTCFRSNRNDRDMLEPTILSRLTKPRGEEYLPIRRAIGDRLSDTRNNIELNFGYHKARFQSQSGEKGTHRISACIRWAHSEVANSFALENIHCFPKRLWDPSTPPIDHPFFDTDPLNNVEADYDVLNAILMDGETPDDAAELLQLQADRDRIARDAAAEFGYDVPVRSQHYDLFDSFSNESGEEGPNEQDNSQSISDEIEYSDQNTANLSASASSLSDEISERLEYNSNDSCSGGQSSASNSGEASESSIISAPRKRKRTTEELFEDLSQNPLETSRKRRASARAVLGRESC